MQQHLGRHLKSSPCPLFFPPRTRARVGGTPGRTAFHPDAALRHPVRRFAGCDVIGFRFGISYARVRHRGFPIPSRLPCSWAVPASEWPRCSCAVHASWDSPSASGRLKPYPAGRNDQRRTRRSRVLALRPNPVLLRLAPYPVSPFGSRGSCRNGGSPSCSQNCAGYGLRVWLS